VDQPPYSSADVGDAWYRRVLKKSELAETRNDLAQKLKGQFVRPPEGNIRPWSLELSGRLLSISGDVVEDATRKSSELNRVLTKPRYEFRGLFFASVCEVRQCGAGAFDVYLDQTVDDRAHANLVVYDAGVDAEGEIDQSLLLDLVERIEFIAPDAPRLMEIQQRAMRGHDCE